MRILLLFLFCLPGMLTAQDRIADSLKVELAKGISDSARVELNNSLSKHYGLTDALMSRKYGLAAEQLAQTIGFQKGQTNAQLLVGNSHLMMGQYDEALQYYFKSLRLSEASQDTLFLISSYINLGNVYNKTHDFDRAVQYYSKAAEIAERTRDVQRLGSAYNNLGDIAEARKDFPTALGYYNKAIRLQEQAGNKRGLAIGLHNLGYLHLHLGRPAEGLEHLFKSVALSLEVGNDMIRLSTLGRISELYLAIGKPEQALQFATQSYEMAVKTGSSKKIAEASRYMHSAYAALQDYARAYEYMLVHDKHKDVLHEESRERMEAELTVQYETEQIEAENILLKAEQERQASELKTQRWFIAAAMGVLLVLVVLLVELIKSRSLQQAAYRRLEEAHTLARSQQNEIAQQSEQLRVQNERLARQSDFQHKVFSIISHDLRGPFASVKSVLTLAMRKSMTEADTKRIFGLLNRDMDVANSMLDNILIWAKAQLDDANVHLLPVSLQTLADETLTQVKSHADKKEIVLVNQVGADAYAQSDKERLTFVLRNLLMNAIKFSTTGGEIVIAASKAENSIALQVKDSGKGISPANISKLFTEKRFTTLGTSGEKGTGLGLMLCKELLESFGGSIRVESTEGIGSSFFVEMPLAIPVTEAVEGEAELV